MASRQSLQWVSACTLFLILCNKSESKCLISERKDSYCDNLQDLYNLNITDSVIITPNDLRELMQVSPERAKNIKRLTINGGLNEISEGAFGNFVNIDFLGLHRNKLPTIRAGVFTNLENLKNLHLQENGIENIEPEAFKNLPNLTVLRLDENNLTSIPKNVFNNLSIHTLTLSQNQIASIEESAFASMPNLRRLYLNDNYLTQFNVQNYVSDVSNIERLWLQWNDLTQITNYMLEGLTNLKVLNLGFNSISSIEPRTFGETPKLSTLVLSNNLLKVVDGSILPQNGLSQLRILYLDNNKLMYLSSTFLFKLNALKFMSLGGNPWYCNCLDLVLRWLDDNRVKLTCDKSYFNGSRPVCISPSTRNELCDYSYDEKLYELFESQKDMYPPVPGCWL